MPPVSASFVSCFVISRLCPLSAGSLAVAGQESRISTSLVASSSILTTAKTVVAPRGVLSRFNRRSCPVTTPVQACAIFAPACRVRLLGLLPINFNPRNLFQRFLPSYIAPSPPDAPSCPSFST